MSLHIVALLLLWMGPAASQSQPPPANEIFARAVRSQQSGDLEGALRDYQEFLKLHPGTVEAHSNLGAVYAGLGDFGRAIGEYRSALALNDGRTEVWFNLGVAYYKMTRLTEAVPALARVLSVQPDNRNAVLLLADCHLRLGENEKVVELLERFESAVDDRAALFLLGTALIRENQVERGQQLVDRILREGDSAEARFLLGSARMMGRDYKGAVEEFARAIALNPRLPAAHSSHGRALLATGDRIAARKSFEQELEIDPTDFDSHLMLGVFLKQDHEFDQALNYFETALKLRPGHPSVRYQIGSTYVAMGSLEPAREILEELTKEEPEFVEAHVSLATVYYRLRRQEDGDRHREIVLKLNAEIQERAPKPGGEFDLPYRGEIEVNPEPARSTEAAPEGVVSFESLSERAEGARQAGQVGQATDLYRRALEIRSAWHEGWWYLGTLLYEERRYLEARDAFTRLVSLKPEGGVAWAMLGLCEFQLQNYDLAYTYLEAARTAGVPAQTHLSVVTRYHLALLLNRMQRPEAALQMLYSLAGKEQDRAALGLAMGIAGLGLRHLPSELPPEDMELASKVGQAQYYAARRQMREAHLSFQELVTQHPQTPNLHYSYGVFLLAEDPEAALEQFRRELEISPGHVPARLEIAFEYLKRSVPEKGLPFAEEAVRLAPDSFAGRQVLGRILLEMGKTERALQELETGRHLAPESPDVHFQLARAYSRVGRKEDADKARQEFRRLDRIRRISREGSKAVGGIEPPPDKDGPQT